MSTAPLGAAPAPPLRPLETPRRVRHLARECVAVMAFSAVASGALAGSLLLLTSLGR
jgi:hypothetical protein